MGSALSRPAAFDISFLCVWPEGTSMTRPNDVTLTHTAVSMYAEWDEYLGRIPSNAVVRRSSSQRPPAKASLLKNLRPTTMSPDEG